MGRFDEAERAYLAIDGGAQAVIDMYKKHRMYSPLVRFVKSHHNEDIRDTYLYIGEELRGEKRWNEAEKFFLSGDDWKSALEMYR